MSRRSGYGPGPGETGSFSEAFSGSYALSGQDPNAVLEGLDPSQLAANRIDFSNVDLSGIDLDTLGVDMTFISSLDSSSFNAMDVNLFNAVPVDSVGDVANNVVTEIAGDTVVSLWDTLADIFSTF